MEMKYADGYVNYIQHGINNTRNLIIIALTNFTDPDDTYLRTLLGVSLLNCEKLSDNIDKHYGVEGKDE